MTPAKRPANAAEPGHDRDGFNDMLATLAGVEGWMSDDQSERLWQAAACVRGGGRIVEIGSFRGRSMIVLARAAPDDAELVAIDPHAGSDRGPGEIAGYEAAAAGDNRRFHENLAAAGVADRVRHVRAFSGAAHAAVDDPIELCHIDGAHRFAPARADIAGWGARVAPGGTLLIHDAFSSVGVTLAIVAELFCGTEFGYVGRSRSLAEYRREPQRGTARVANLVHQALELGWFVRNLAIKGLISARLGALTRVLGHDPREWPY